MGTAPAPCQAALMIEIKTEHLALRRFQLTDAARLAACRNNYVWCRPPRR